MVRGIEDRQESLFAYVRLEERIPKKHPLRKIRKLVDKVLSELDWDFEKLYADTGRASIPPEQLLRALLLQIFYTIRSERQLIEQLEYNLLCRWFVGIGIEGTVWNATVFTKNRDRLLEGEIVRRFLAEVVSLAQQGQLLSEEHFSVDGTLIEAWASHKSFQPKDEQPPEDKGNWHGKKRQNDTHQSVTDPEARLYKKSSGQETKLCFMGHVLMENRNGLVVDTQTTLTSGMAEREAGLDMIKTKRDEAKKPYEMHFGKGENLIKCLEKIG